MSKKLENIIREAMSDDKIDLFKDKEQDDLIDIKDIKKSKFNRSLPQRMSEWNNNDFFNYCRKLHCNNFPHLEWSVVKASGCQTLLIARDILIDFLGFCDNMVFKDYLSWFYDKMAYMEKERYGLYYFFKINKKDIIKIFVSQYDYAHIAENKNTPKSIDKYVQLLSLDQIQSAYLMGNELFIYKFGIIIPVNWLFMVKKVKLPMATKKVYDICLKAYRHDKFHIIREATECFNPYDTKFVFTKADELVKRVDPQLAVHVELSKQDNRFNFFFKE